MARGTPTAISLGPGYLYAGPVGVTEPSDLATAWAAVSASWVALGYTDEGSEFGYSPSTDNVEVAEELDPVKVVTTGRASTVSFAMAELTATHLQIAMNGGTITAGVGIVTFEPPDLGSETRLALGFESEDHQERWIYRQCFQTGDVSIVRRKGAEKAVIATEFSLEKPSSGAKLYKAIFVSPGRA
jgi:hypothetical protein